MCGIYAQISQENSAAEDIYQGLKTLEYRGYDSWGIAIKYQGAIKIERHIGKIAQAKITLPKSNIGIGHTRWATHGGVTEFNAHPHVDCSGKIALVHNGIVENYQTLKSDLYKKSHKFTTETDSEVIVHLIEEFAKKSDIKTAVFKAFKQLEGSNAIAVLDIDSESIIACRNGSPLIVGLNDNEFYLASDVTAFLKKTKKAVYIDNKQGVVISSSEIKLYDLTEMTLLTPKIEIIDWKVEEAQKGGYAHFLLKEIMEQPNTILKTSKINEREIKKIAEKIKDSRLAIIGCGTAYFCSLAGQYFFAEAGVNCNAYGAYEFAPFARFYDDKTITIAVSQSGETADTIDAARKAKESGSFLVAIVNTRGSTLERMADLVIPVSAGPEIAVISTKAFTSQLTTLYLIAEAVNNQYPQAVKQLEKMCQELEVWLTSKINEDLIKIVKKIIDDNNIYLIGKYLNYPASMEFALKIKETSYIHSEAFASGELKHGVITLIQKGTPCIVLASRDNTQKEILSSASELKARGGFIIGVAPFAASEFDNHLSTPDFGRLTIFPNIIVGQLMGYYLGIGRGADPDKPRNLAKSVTVK
ncbi:glutamine--fructose-6-phosphate transaminase (isomerizing) [Candidatus Roizmanbacteria bacterium RIFCSPHIGHO2_02_FULL_37_13b]|uniref:Glutamine--fructose-6-phosphate aminotransferase [isomerizing] n=1 Tax=Candidatus Roizmanbacteria bacterium RIFCSPLOWO2_02_FULL_36_11 TaxID=1802071 RepID=A0A1F7JH30_9BACT|nr:MAG: glutamine--fructose-6-phosphate transaminase (isomerizing) [Candidatus Roizmanbacteria bacterium RIFCSPHIGHO2_02_FULL_37_13b]OGK54876.1 MAG: glutamine--fructose-6-phosphate transaminase (isomerizing) [Candidatus Roizmanbacteria bacterium RIFCSPLOWO2_02_FULL_36_11]